MSDWGRPPQKKQPWSDFKMIALWVFIIGAVGYLLFPNILSFLTNQNTDAATTMGDVVLPDAADADADAATVSDGLTLPSVFDALYQESEISTGYWIMYVGDGELKQLQLTASAYDFVMSVLEKDLSTQEFEGSIPLLVATNGQIKKYMVSEQIFDIIHNLTDIAGRAGSI
ncbi:MAG: hypothetical protein LBB49_04385 [Gracilibacteraceae bacterium]|jgi:hypothetical protein|nr:hypothetical protein [Gracilibacteraceae bacterium]